MDTPLDERGLTVCLVSGGNILRQQLDEILGDNPAWSAPNPYSP
jgi:hypothetical protein